MKTRIALMMAMICLGLASLVSGAESTKYPAPRFPSYLRPPKSLDDIMPFARAAVRQTGGRTPLGLVEKGMGALIASATFPGDVWRLAEERVLVALGWIASKPPTRKEPRCISN